ncbi:MAG: hypothetical protein A3A28_06050 [Candidatus Sungbacteria bacterium RIFCSPLOWO2_01_FULL_47_32]|uniref:Solute-binding protein family 5 domain-containing protein n=1 Tax=Candidatus Sungbacteria bacterium RIFCSPHIGHO2_01_FULL_47_32 TaxID=1802264 RepID=A0A1G2K8S1_9BACT|nr:MAG: Extracellular solute-binding protein [Parcubacteria group bacterium GW2011_GWA2_47_10]OGZ95829.1 MAG: hypothetical protein A2633_00335 [Candidatus Sungbacteria bacterium RIFCSPHIGHO2_01_FULL_47_32]OGZ98621.1 MAG: hypothetical protein A3D57_03570 [Candidatus Sungbacteria bacterium RIFCSPHIGHO2_02_FULL_46_12]OHA04426.1 MAG: hypothetical protein A3A28_06050 [Candidatus Sungbacteria bacterium RIFCSPLOWO2_01_FULL_47_32]
MHSLPAVREFANNPSVFSLWKNWRRRILYFPRLFTKKEKLILGLLIIVFASSASTFLFSFFMSHTVSAPRNAGTYREGLMTRPRFINPLYLSNNDTDRDLTGLIFSSLIRYDSKGNIIPDLAESWELSPDNKTYTFHLVKNALWHDGEKVTADDVLFTIKTIQNLEYKSPLRQNWQGVSVQKLDDYTVSFTLRVPYSPFLENATTFILPEHIWGRIPPQSSFISEFNRKPVGSGKYVFSALKTSTTNEITSYTLIANSRYYREPSHISNLIFTFYASEGELIRAYKKGELDGFGSISPEHIADLKKQDMNVYALRIPRIFAVFLNQNKFPAFKDVRVRNALSLAIDKDALIRDVLKEGAIPADSPIPPGTFGYAPLPDNLKITPNQSVAIETLEKAGWKKNDNGIYAMTAKQDGKKVDMTLSFELVTSDVPELIQTAEFIQKSLAVIGIDVRITSLSTIDLEAQNIRTRSYDALLFGETVGHDPDPYPFWHTSQIRDPGLNIALFANRQADVLLEDARHNPNTDTRRKEYADFQNIVRKNFGALFLYSPTYYYGVRSIIKGIDLQNIVVPAERFNEIDNWYIKTRRSWKTQKKTGYGAGSAPGHRPDLSSAIF